MKRRDFIKGMLRGGALGGLIGGGAELVRRNGIDRDAHICAGGGVCMRCDRSEKCVLPAAVSRRNREGGQS